MDIIFPDNLRIASINLTVRDTAHNLHNSHSFIELRSGHDIDMDNLMARLRMIHGVSDVSLRGETIDIGTRSPTNYHEVMKDTLGFLQEHGLLSETEVRKAYKAFGLRSSRGAGQLLGREV